MGNFKQNRNKRFSGSRTGGFSKRSGGQSSFYGKSSGESRGRGRGPVTMHQVVCDECGKTCEVPFLPTAGKPVYCNACFEGKRETGNSRGGDRFSSQKKFNTYKPQFKTDFRSNTGREDNTELKKQLELLNAKMDQLIKVVEAITKVKPSVTKKETIKEAKKDSVISVKKLLKKVSKKTKK